MLEGSGHVCQERGRWHDVRLQQFPYKRAGIASMAGVDYRHCSFTVLRTRPVGTDKPASASSAYASSRTGEGAERHCSKVRADARLYESSGPSVDKLAPR